MPFPDRIWEGGTPTRKNLSDTMSATHADFVTIVLEIQAIERYLLSLANNVNLMPDLDSKIKEADQKLAELKAKIQEVTAPADLKTLVDTLAERLETLDVRPEVIKLRSDLNLLERSLTEVKLTTDALHKSIKSDLSALQHVTRNEINKLRSQFEARFNEQEAENQRLNKLLSIASQIQELNRS